MGKSMENAVNHHRSGNSCSASVLRAFADAAGLTDQEAQRVAAPMAGGRMVKCGAVLAAERVLQEKYGEASEPLIRRFEEEFIAKNRSAVCAEIRGGRLRSCRGCVQDSAELLEQMLSERD